LQKGLTAGSYALDDQLTVLVTAVSDNESSIEVKTSIFYTSLTPGCACPGDPTVEDEQLEQCEVLVTIDKRTAEAAFALLDD
jgi:hypothetical protein